MSDDSSPTSETAAAAAARHKVPEHYVLLHAQLSGTDEAAQHVSIMQAPTACSLLHAFDLARGVPYVMSRISPNSCALAQRCFQPLTRLM